MTSSDTPTAPATAAAGNGNLRKRMMLIFGVLGVVAAVGGGLYWLEQQRYVFTDKAQVTAPLIKLAPESAGILKKVIVKEGDPVFASQTVGRVGDEMIQARVAGQVIAVKQDIGASYAIGDTVVTMIEPKEMRVVARIEEDKGLKDIYIGQKAFFTVDAFGSRRFEGTVESVSQTNREGDVVFNISDKREVKEFEVKISYDTDALSQFQNGMSARVWIVK